MGNKVAGGNYAILRNERFAVPLKNLINFRRSIEMSLINYKVELKIKWTKSCVLAVNANDNANFNRDNIIFTNVFYLSFIIFFIIKWHRKLWNYQNFLAKDLKDQCIGMNIKQKAKNKNTTNEYSYFLESNFVWVNRLFVLIYPDQERNPKRYRSKRYYLPNQKALLGIIMSSWLERLYMINPLILI